MPVRCNRFVADAATGKTENGNRGNALHAFYFCAGIACLFIALFDAFQTVILPRRATGRFRITRMYFALTWWPWSHVVGGIKDARRRETALSYYGPMSLILLIAVWAGALVFGFALLFSSLRAPLNDPTRAGGPDFFSDLYISGTTIFTLGLGDLTPHSPWARLFVVLESGIGLGFLAMVIG